MDDAFLTPAVQIVAGLLILFLGRRLFWLFVGVVGFFFGVQFAVKVLGDLSDWMVLLIALLVGIVSAALTMALQRLAVILAGGIAGGLLAMRIAPAAGMYTEDGILVAFVAGAFLMAVVFYVLFDPALITISSARRSRSTRPRPRYIC